MYQQIELPDDELLVCLFLRGSDEPVNELAIVDFQRRMERLNKPPEGGISFYRKDRTSLKFIVENVLKKPKKTRGFATISAGRLRDLRFKIYADSSESKHVCLHCEKCNGIYEDCAPCSGKCPFVPAEQSGSEGIAIRKRLAESMSILFPAKEKRETILGIFRTDVDESDPIEANKVFEYRLNAILFSPKQ